MNLLLENILDILYPRRCPICQEVVKKRGEMICPSCRKEIAPIQEPVCKKCGKPIMDAAEEYCCDCGKMGHLYTRGLAVLPYTGKVRKSLHQIKFHNKKEYLDFYGPYMAEVLGKRILAWDAQALIPVPLHHSKRRKRGFNQAEILAVEVGRALGIPVRTDVVQRIRNTRPQKDLSLRERQNNLKGAFKIIQYDVKLKKIILVDDIYTTGSTIDGIAGKLLEQGAEEVYFIALCIGKDDG